jgi:uncharacterized phage-associated protein
MPIVRQQEKVTAMKVAEFFIWMCNQTGSYISNLKLQKILYYAQGWHLGLYGKPLFDAKFQAWIHGPAIPHVYGNFKSFGFQPIFDKKIKKPEFNPDTESFLTEIAKVFFSYDAYELELATHREPPWLNARKGLAADAPCKNIISDEDMRTFFASQKKA